jgi:3-hydroxyisobutyrate dehydrogenase
MPTRKIAVVGLGGMGSGLAHALVAAGFPVTVFNRTAAKAAPLGQVGATVVDSAAAAAKDADVVLLSLSDEHAVEEVLFGEMAGVLSQDVTVIDTTTVSVAYAQAAAKRLHDLGFKRVEACVLGNPLMAKAGQVRVFAAGVESDVDDVRDVLEALSQEVRYLGPPGHATTLKLAFNLLLGLQTAALAETVQFAEGVGVDRGLLLDALDNSGWRSPVLSFRGQFMRTGKYEPAGFRTTLMHKDIQLALDAVDVPLPLTAQASRHYEAAIAAGRGDEDAAVVADVVTTDPPVGHQTR